MQKVRIIYFVKFSNGGKKLFRDKTTTITTIEKSLRRFLNYDGAIYVKAFKCYNDEQISKFNQIAYSGYNQKTGEYYRVFI